ncbi:uncharacterized protein LOC129802583 [Phlebotomus papatasi]|uniref:uncharacterized protein LOC129802583 n=1 Tax=Phlebotomus papatasi TaxID=29031 RepID=UPI0024835808|nr:uncharacterized protein LOC129802583 [Phlebotomus papatasi]XP_055704496.1 uncharacterized protein LOC129802583 [Phlebotomus papatasi]
MSGDSEGAAPDLGKLKDFLNKRDFKMPKMEEIMKVLDQMNMPEEEKEKLRANLLNNRLTPRPNYLIFIVTVALVLLIFVFIGRKLYKTLTAKDRKQAEKKKLKEEKKAKQKDESKNTKKSKGERDKSKTKQN